MRPGITARKETCPSSPHLRPIRTWPNARKRSSPRNSAAEVLLCDTGVLLAAGNVKDHAHQACLRLLRHAEGPLLVPSPVLGEIGYLLQSRAGPLAVRRMGSVARMPPFPVAAAASGCRPRGSGGDWLHGRQLRTAWA